MIKTADNNDRLTIQPENFTEARAMVNGINIFYEKKGIVSSQRAKYDLPNWALIALFLPGRNRLNKSITPTQISELLKKKNINKTPKAIYNILQNMIYAKRSIHPHRRSIGVSCFDLIEAMGGVKFITLTPEETGHPISITAYHFGKSHEEVKAVRRKYGLRIRD